MAEVKEAMESLENALRRYDQAFGILFHLALIDERGTTLYDTLVEVEEQVSQLDDSRLSQLYERLIEGHRTFMPKYQQVLDSDSQAFNKRLVKLGLEASVQANEADISLREAAGLDASNGIWGPQGWRPPGA